MTKPTTTPTTSSATSSATSATAVTAVTASATATVRLLMGICISAASLFLSAAFIASSWYAALAMLGIGLLWLSVLRHGNCRVADWGLFLVVLCAIWGGFEGLAWGWLLTAVAVGLAGWDLTHYLAHLQAAPEHQRESVLVRRHLQRLAGVTMGGWMLAGLTLTASIQLNYIGAIILAGVAVILLTRTVRILRSRRTF